MSLSDDLDRDRGDLDWNLYGPDDDWDAVMGAQTLDDERADFYGIF